MKTAKRLMTKACEAGTDPFLALLEWRNCPSEQLSQAPVELLMGRKTRTTLPIAAPLLHTHCASSAHTALQQAKNTQAHYYNRTARQRPTLQCGQTVRFRHDDKQGRKGEISTTLPYRSYEIQLEDGSTRRRTSKHVRFSNEPPLILNEDTGPSLGTNTPYAPPTTEKQVARSDMSNATTHDAEPSQPFAAATVSPPQQATEKQTTTRSGRVIRKPVRYQN